MADFGKLTSSGTPSAYTPGGYGKKQANSRSAWGTAAHLASIPFRPVGALLNTGPVKGALFALDEPRAIISAGINAAEGGTAKQSLDLLVHHKPIADVLDQRMRENIGVGLFEGSGLPTVLSRAFLSLITDMLLDPVTYLGVGLVDEVGNVRRVATGTEEALNLGERAAGTFKASLARRGVAATMASNPEEFASKLGTLTLTMGGHAIPGTENLARAMLTPTKLKEPILEALTVDSKAKKLDGVITEMIARSPLAEEAKATVTKALLGHDQEVLAERTVRQIGIGGKKPRIQEAARAALKSLEGGTAEDVAKASAHFDATLAGTHAKSLVRAVSQKLARHVDENLGEIGVGVARDFGKDLADGGAAVLNSAFKQVKEFERTVGLMTPSVQDVQHAAADLSFVQRRAAAGLASADELAAATEHFATISQAAAASGTEGWSKDGFRAFLEKKNLGWDAQHEIAFAATDAMRKSLDEVGLKDKTIIDSLLHGDMTVAVKTDAEGLQLVAEGGDPMQAGGFFSHVQRHVNGFGKAETDAAKYGRVARKADRVLTGRYSIVGEAVRSSFEDVARDLSARTMSAAGGPLEKTLREAGLYQDFTGVVDAGMELAKAKSEQAANLADQARLEADIIDANLARRSARQRRADAVLAQQQFEEVGLAAANVNKVPIPTNLPEHLDEATAAMAHETLAQSADKYREQLTLRVSHATEEQARAEAHFEQLKAAAMEAQQKGFQHERLVDNAQRAAMRALDDMPGKLKAKHGAVFGSLYTAAGKKAIAEDAFWTERALGLISTEYVQHGAAGWLDKESSQYIASLLHSEDNVGKLLNKVTGITSYMRSAMLLSPSFHSRNMIGAAINNMFYGVRLKDYRAFTRMYYSDPAEWSESFRALVSLLPSADRRLAIGQAAMGLNPTEYDRPSARLMQHLSSKLEEYSPVKNALAGRFTHGEDSLQVETMARGALFMKLTEQRGMNPEAAWAMVGKVHVDYTDVSRLDVSIRRVVPFYMYMSRNLPLQLEFMARGGSFGSRLDSHLRNSQDGEMPPFAMNSYLNLGHGYSFNMGGLNPATDLFGSRAGDSGAQAPAGILGQVRDGINPVISNLWFLLDGQKRGKGYGYDSYLMDLFPTYRSVQSLVAPITPENLPQALRPATRKDRTGTLVNIGSTILAGSPIRTFNR